VYRALMRLPRRIHWTSPNDKLKVEEALADIELPRGQAHARKRFMTDK